MIHRQNRRSYVRHNTYRTRHNNDKITRMEFNPEWNLLFEDSYDDILYPWDMEHSSVWKDKYAKTQKYFAGAKKKALAITGVCVEKIKKIKNTYGNKLAVGVLNYEG